MRLIPAAGQTIGLYRCGGQLHAIEDRCTHDDGPLCEGEWDPSACEVICPRHGSRFDLRTGAALTLPAYLPVDDLPGARARRRHGRDRGRVAAGRRGDARVGSARARRPRPQRDRAPRGRGRGRARGGRPGRRALPRGRARGGTAALRARGAERRLRGARDRRLPGYSTIWLAAAARILGGRVVSLEQDPRKIEAWRENIADAGLEEWAELVEGNALETLETVEDGFDVVFIDAWKADYEAYFQIARGSSTRARVVADNVVRT